MKHLKLFENFALDDDSLSIARDIAKALFGDVKWDKGEHSSSSSYAYGQTYRFKDGTTEKGYVIDDTIVKIKAPAIALKFMDKAAVDELMTLIGDSDPAEIYPLNHVEVDISKARMITSKRTESRATASLGPYGNISSGNAILDKSNIKTISKDLLDLLEAGAKKIKGETLVKMVFDSGAYGKVLKKTKDENDGGKSRHQGIGRHSSTNVSYDIKRGYDVSAYVKKYGEKKLKDIVMSTHFGKKSFRGIENGVMLTDESWTDTYD